MSPDGPRARLLNRESLAWIWYDLCTSAYNSVVVTFVFSVYLTSSAFGPTDETSTALGRGLAIAAIVVAALAPVLGQRSDRSGNSLAALGVASGMVWTIIAGLFFIRPDPTYLWPGVIALAVATVVAEIATVHYNALLKRVSTPQTVGRISALGWASGYLGSIVLLLLLLYAFIKPEVGLFGVTNRDGLDIRVSMLVTAAWYACGMVPILIVMRGTGTPRLDSQGAQPEEGPVRPARRETLAGSYRALLATIRDLARTAPHTLRFLIASAVFRDGLIGVFTFGGVIAAGTFGFTSADVVVFAVAANLVAGVATALIGLASDALGPLRVIVGSLACTVAAGVGIFALHDRGPVVFWVLGLTLCLFVGPAQAASRGMLTRMIPPGRDGEVFGLYQTSGRALSFLSPALFTAAIALGQRVDPQAPSTQYWGILGIMAVVFAGLLAMLWVRADESLVADDTWSA